MTIPVGAPACTVAATGKALSDQTALRQTASPINSRELGPTALVGGIHLTAALLFVHRVLPHLTTRLAGLPGDSAQFAWGLSYTPWALLHGTTPLLTDRVIAPDGVNLMWNTTTPLLGILAAPVSLGFGPVVAYNAVLIAVLVANGLSFYLAMSRFVRDRIARAVASLFWAYSGYVVAHALGHLNLTFVALVPPLLVLLHELAVRQVWRARRTGMLLGLILGAQLLVSADMLLSETLAAVVGLLLLAVLRPRHVRSRIRYLVQSCLSAVLVLAVIGAYPLWVQFRGPQRITAGTFHSPGVYVADLRELVVPTLGWLKGSAYGFGPSHFSGDLAEWNSYLGIPLLLIAVVTVVALRRRLLVLWAGVFALIITVLSFGPHLHIDGASYGPLLPWALLSKVPELMNVLPSRLAIYSDLAVALLLAVAIQVVRRQASAAVRWCGLLVGVSVAATLIPASLPSASAETPGFMTSSTLKQVVPADSTVLVLPFSTGTSGTFDAVSALVWQAQARMWFRMPEGYWLIPSSDPLHRGEPQIGPNLSPLIRVLLELQDGRSVPPPVAGDVAASLRAQGIQRILLGPMTHRAQVSGYLTASLGRADVHSDGIDVWLPAHWSASTPATPAKTAATTRAAQGQSFYGRKEPLWS